MNQGEVALRIRAVELAIQAGARRSDLGDLARELLAFLKGDDASEQIAATPQKKKTGRRTPQSLPGLAE